MKDSHTRGNRTALDQQQLRWANTDPPEQHQLSSTPQPCSVQPAWPPPHDSDDEMCTRRALRSQLRLEIERWQASGRPSAGLWHLQASPVGSPPAMGIRQPWFAALPAAGSAEPTHQLQSCTADLPVQQHLLPHVPLTAGPTELPDPYHQQHRDWQQQQLRWQSNSLQEQQQLEQHMPAFLQWRQATESVPAHASTRPHSSQQLLEPSQTHQAGLCTASAAPSWAALAMEWQPSGPASQVTAADVEAHPPAGHIAEPPGQHSSRRTSSLSSSSATHSASSEGAYSRSSRSGCGGSGASGSDGPGTSSVSTSPRAQDPFAHRVKWPSIAAGHVEQARHTVVSDVSSCWDEASRAAPPLPHWGPTLPPLTSHCRPEQQAGVTARMLAVVPGLPALRGEQEQSRASSDMPAALKAAPQWGGQPGVGGEGGGAGGQGAGLDPVPQPPSLSRGWQGVGPTARQQSHLATPPPGFTAPAFVASAWPQPLLHDSPAEADVGRRSWQLGGSSTYGPHSPGSERPGPWGQDRDEDRPWATATGSATHCPSRSPCSGSSPSPTAMAAATAAAAAASPLYLAGSRKPRPDRLALSQRPTSPALPTTARPSRRPAWLPTPPGQRPQPHTAPERGAPPSHPPGHSLQPGAAGPPMQSLHALSSCPSSPAPPQPQPRPLAPQPLHRHCPASTATPSPAAAAAAAAAAVLPQRPPPGCLAPRCLPGCKPQGGRPGPVLGR
ncbi:hypothetical protein V8C86DRAFT_882612 [Haematococcus lacustris]